jgi:hypothetical protein
MERGGSPVGFFFEKKPQQKGLGGREGYLRLDKYLEQILINVVFEMQIIWGNIDWESLSISLLTFSLVGKAL